MNKEYTALWIMILNIMRHLDRRDFIAIDLITDFLVVSWEDKNRTELCATFQAKNNPSNLFFHQSVSIHYLQDGENYFNEYVNAILDGKHIKTTLKLNDKYLTDIRV